MASLTHHALLYEGIDRETIKSFNANKSLMDLLVKDRLIPDLWPERFNLARTMQITFGNKQINFGQSLSLDECNAEPIVSFDFEHPSTSAPPLFCIMMIDLDTNPEKQTTNQIVWRNWLKINVNGDAAQTSGSTVSRFEPPKAGGHRIALLLFHQNAYIEFNDAYRRARNDRRADWDFLNKFVECFHLGSPESVFYFKTSGDAASTSPSIQQPVDRTDEVKVKEPEQQHGQLPQVLLERFDEGDITEQLQTRRDERYDQQESSGKSWMTGLPRSKEVQPPQEEKPFIDESGMPPSPSIPTKEPTEVTPGSTETDMPSAEPGTLLEAGVDKLVVTAQDAAVKVGDIGSKIGNAIGASLSAIGSTLTTESTNTTA